MGLRVLNCLSEPQLQEPQARLQVSIHSALKRGEAVRALKGLPGGGGAHFDAVLTKGLFRALISGLMKGPGVPLGSAKQIMRISSH